MGDQVRVDRGAIQNHTNATLGNKGSLRGLNDDTDRRQAHIQNTLENGVGSEQVQGQRTGAKRHADDIDAGVQRTAQRTSENADQFIQGVRNAAERSLRQI